MEHDSQIPDGSKSGTMFRRVRNELAIEIGFILVCLVLAVGLESKVMLAVAFTCLKFAIPHFITAFLVYRADPSKAHGAGLAFLFCAMGLVRASLFAFCAVFIAAVAMIPFFGAGGPGNVAAIGLGTGFMCAIGFLLLVFPLALTATTISWRTKTKLEFASGLTKLRRASENKKAEIQLDVQRSLTNVSVASGLSICVMMVSLMVFPNAHWIFMVAAFVLPLAWIPFFGWVVAPRDLEMPPSPSS